MDYGCCRQWGWELRAGDGEPAVWRNPGDGFGTGCVDWAPVTQCFSQALREGFMFELRTR